jgi:hypothetical protein
VSWKSQVSADHHRRAALRSMSGRAAPVFSEQNALIDRFAVIGVSH